MHEDLYYVDDFAYQALERIASQINGTLGARVKELGTSNTPSTKVMDLLANAERPPIVWQKQCTVYNCIDEQVLHVLEKHSNITLAGYGLLNPSSEFLNAHEEPIVKSLARKYAVSTNQLLLAWVR